MGVWVHADGLHVHATHYTWPINGIANLWDLVRVLKFGELDKAEDDFERLDIESLPVQGRPSHLAMVAWVRDLPEIQAATEDLFQKVDRAANLKELDAVCAIAKICDMGDMQRSALASAVVARSKRIGQPVNLPDIKRLLKPNKAKQQALPAKKNERTPSLPTNRNTPQWLFDWCYLTDTNEFYKYGVKRRMNREGFNAQFGRRMAEFAGESGNIPLASRFALEIFQLPCFSRDIYLPGAEPYFKREGQVYVNAYSPASVPKAADEPNAEAVALVENHIKLLCGGRPEVVKHVIDWLAHNVQFPGLKINHSLVIQGIEGCGKSVLGELLARVMGPVNVNKIAPEVIAKSDFNGWSEGFCVGVLEEIRLAGANRHDLLNKVKPLITDETICVHRKGVDPYNSPNTMNYIAFTNFKDALPVGESDRRWMVIFAPWDSNDDFLKAIGKTADGYFDRLFGAIRDYTPSLRRWLLDRDLSDFNRHGRAPTTAEKASMIALGLPDDASTAKMLIEEGGVGYSQEVVSSALLSKAFAALGYSPPGTTRMHRLLSGLGFRQFIRTGLTSKPTKWNGSTHRVWTREAVTTDEHIRHLLDATTRAQIEKDFED